MMKKIPMIVALVATALFAGCKPDNPSDKPDNGGGNSTVPVINLGIQGNLMIASDGGVVTLPYVIVNPVEGGTISADAGSCTWLGSFSYGSDVITMTAQPNTETSNRNAILAVTYTYDGGKTVETQVNVIQRGTLNYDYNIDAKVFTGYYYGTANGATEGYRYYTMISDLEMYDSQYGLAGGTYYRLDIYSNAPESETNPLPEPGTYTLGESGRTLPMTFSVDSSYVFGYNDRGVENLNVRFTEGTLVVSRNGNEYTFDAELIDTDGMIHHVEYTGEVDYIRFINGYPILDRDVVINASICVPQFFDEVDDIMEVNINFSDMQVNSSGGLVPPGNRLYVCAYMPFSNSGILEAGTYTVNSSPEWTTKKVRAGMDVPALDYTLIEYTDEKLFSTYALVTEGTMEISRNGSAYTIKCNFKTREGHTITCNYSGTPSSMLDLPEPYSTLTGDKVMDMSSCKATAYYYADRYTNEGSYWWLDISPTNSTGDGITIDLVTPETEMSGGIATGTYTPARSRFTPFNYVKGRLSNATLVGTNYIGQIVNGEPFAFAPATAGNIEITKNSNGTYTVKFALLDDKDHTWSGSWTGEVSFVDRTGPNSVAPAKTVGR